MRTLGPSMPAALSAAMRGGIVADPGQHRVIVLADLRRIAT